MDNRIIAIEDYWRSVTRNSPDCQQIAIAMNPEFNKLSQCIKECLNEGFIKDATEYGVGRWEKMLNIIPELNDSLEDRKVRILTQLNVRLPYTWRVLEQMITSFVGAGNYEMSYINDYSKLIIRVKVDTDSQYMTILNLLKNVVPQNVVIDLGRI